jgi:hypothetical protein
MHTIPDHQYNGYTIFTNPGEGARGIYLDAFSIHENIISVPPISLPLVHQRSLNGANEFADRDEAVASALQMAREWIDAHPATL